MIIRKRGIIISVPILVLGFLTVYTIDYIFALVPLLIIIFVLYFHRDPSIEFEENGVISPCSGEVTDIEETQDYTEVSVYLGLLDNHIIRSPVSGTINKITRKEGGNKPAFLNSSEKNNRMVYQYDNLSISVMTGFIARRLKKLVDEDSNVKIGDRICLISFGSRTNIRIYDCTADDIEVSEGEKIRIGQKISSKSWSRC